MRKGLLGFTLIELLIVIALLGALAIGLLAALDPFEQLKKGTDTGTRNTVAEFQGASVRFYSIKNYMPWCDDGTCASPVDGSEPDQAALTDLPNTIAAIVDTGELKTDFSTLAGNQKDNIFVTGLNDPPTAAVCFKPTSKSFRSDPNTKYDKNGIGSGDTGGSGITCPDAANAAAECYYCVK